ncbi:aromatic ring-opening dioxygenase catalytic subunit LigB (macronuclear) [Tetrahymena thermophila SB210]|uniref:Aromatic ring-opening dioxygenase catalytic subunit LigB n=1 Tax=Tetrahymena thermophila (strain SB210) TaxID=312017 RepID=Q23Q23_TETTS|nr:aromatic ring-opening dioxygenase catalytic subunit LigB [Tetrahymena thermophila SB210]EAR98512.1 aromatic ring-opening dioxygenase catalytic subunit LigB [Tetrahymena thermophila SB210]|eukprot:XP_001018757.1 aromatic ring-opening dioxygenase catalytic subunit LigB [Tetrahymena thermophila SB210]
MSNLTQKNLPSVFISHGLVGETLRPGTDLFEQLNKFSKSQSYLPNVETVIIVSGHWECDEITVNLNPQPELDHDHPSEWLYKFDFRLETNVPLANKIKDKLKKSGMTIKTTTTASADHGAWGGLFALYDINTQQKVYHSQNKQYVPKVVLVSLDTKMDPQKHYDLGKILGEFRDEKTMIICSGASTHNFNYNRKPGFTEQSKIWEKWLQSIVTDQNVEIRHSIVNFKQNKLYHYMHHSDDHFMPLVVASGSSREPGQLICLELQFTSMCSCYLFP